MKGIFIKRIFNYINFHETIDFICEKVYSIHNNFKKGCGHHVLLLYCNSTSRDYYSQTVCGSFIEVCQMILRLSEVMKRNAA